MCVKSLNLEGHKMAMMISSTRSHQYKLQNNVSLSTSSHGMVRVNVFRVFDVKPKKLSALYKGVRRVIGGSVKINGTATDRLKVNDLNVGVNGLVEEKRKRELSPDWVGRFVEDSLVFRQCFAIRSYEVGPDQTVSVETLMSHLQETALNSIRLCGSIGDGFGTTLEMSRRNLIWVVSRSQLQVESYPSWHVGVIQMRINMSTTSNILVGFWSMPIDILQDNELANITLEYRRECKLSHTLQSLSSPQVCFAMDSINEPPTICKSIPTLQFIHLLRLQDNGLELLRARTKWRPKLTKKTYTK